MRINPNILIVPLLIMLLLKQEFQQLVVYLSTPKTEIVSIPDPNLIMTYTNKTIYYNGSISIPNAQAFQLFAMNNPEATKVSFSSGGGHYAAIDEFIKVIESEMLEVVVENKNRCMSACASIAYSQFKAGKLTIENGGIVGLHKIKVLADFRSVTPEETMKEHELMLAQFYSDLSSYGFSVEMISTIIKETNEYVLLYPATQNDVIDFMAGKHYMYSGKKP